MTTHSDLRFVQALMAEVAQRGLPQDVAGYRVFLDQVLEQRKNREPLPEVGAYHRQVRISSRFTADIALPPHSRTGSPVVLICHGNGGIAGSAHSYRRFTRDWAAAGYVAVTPDYRLGPEYRHPAGLDDLIETGMWLKVHAAEYGGDPEKLVVVGDSIGATLALATVLRLLEVPQAPRIRAYVGLEGFYDLTEDESFIIKALLPEGCSKEDRRHPSISPTYGIKAGQAMPAMLLIAGGADFAAPPTLKFAAELCQKGIQFELHIIEGMPHDFMKFPELDGYRRGHAWMFDFLARHP